MTGGDALARALVQEQPAGGLSHRTGVIVAVYPAPPHARVDVRVGDTVVPGVRYASSITSPAPGDVVVVRITRSGGSGRRGGRVRGGAPYVESRIAV